MRFLSETMMAKRLDFERDLLRRKAAKGLTIKDEQEFIGRDLASRWLGKVEERLLQRKYKQSQHPASNHRRLRTSGDRSDEDSRVNVTKRPARPARPSKDHRRGKK